MKHFQNIIVHSCSREVEIPSDYSQRETVSVSMKASSFLNTIDKMFGALPVSEIMRELDFVACERRLKISRNSEFKLAQEELLKRIKQN